MWILCLVSLPCWFLFLALGSVRETDPEAGQLEVRFRMGLFFYRKNSRLEGKYKRIKDELITYLRMILITVYVNMNSTFHKLEVCTYDA